MSHKFPVALRALFAACAFFAFLTSCDKDDDDDNPSDNTITALVVANNDFSTLETAVIKANLQTTLSGAGPFTVFAPDNAAFAASGISEATLNGLNQS